VINYVYGARGYGIGTIKNNNKQARKNSKLYFSPNKKKHAKTQRCCQTKIF